MNSPIVTRGPPRIAKSNKSDLTHVLKRPKTYLEATATRAETRPAYYWPSGSFVPDEHSFAAKMDLTVLR